MWTPPLMQAYLRTSRGVWSVAVICPASRLRHVTRRRPFMRRSKSSNDVDLGGRHSSFFHVWPSGGLPHRVRNVFLHRSCNHTRTHLLSGRLPATRRTRTPIPLAAGTTFRGWGPSVCRDLSARPAVGHSPPGPAAAASDWAGLVDLVPIRRIWRQSARDRSHRTAKGRRATCGRAPRSSPGGFVHALRRYVVQTTPNARSLADNATSATPFE